MATEKRLIDANEMKNNIMEAMMRQFEKNGDQIALRIAEMMCHFIDETDAVDAVEVVHGWWIELPGMEPDYKCSECGRSYAWWEPNEAHYCPNCGAKMDEETKFVGICERCEYRDECDWPKLHPKIELKKCPDFNEGEKNKNG